MLSIDRRVRCDFVIVLRSLFVVGCSCLLLCVVSCCVDGCLVCVVFFVGCRFLVSCLLLMVMLCLVVGVVIVRRC